MDVFEQKDYTVVQSGKSEADLLGSSAEGVVSTMEVKRRAKFGAESPESLPAEDMDGESESRSDATEPITDATEHGDDGLPTAARTSSAVSEKRLQQIERASRRLSSIYSDEGAEFRAAMWNWF